MMQTLRVAAYCRVSTDKDDQANSLTSQKSFFREYIQNHDGWKLVEIYADEGISGTSTKKREQFNRMIADCHDKKIDLIVTKEVSRFARNTVDTLDFTRKLKDIGVGVIFINDNIDTRDKDGEFRLTIMASVAQEESRKTSERVKWGQARRMEKGVVFGRDLLGYQVENGTLIVNEDEREIVRMIFRKFLLEGKGTHVIARELREAGIRPKRVKEWTNSTILRILRNEKYAGDLCQKKTLTPNFLTHKKITNKGHEEMIVLKDHHEAIVDRDVWEKTQAELERRSPPEEQKSKHSNRYWCSGKILCGECGYSFVSRTKPLKSGERYKSWRCFQTARHGGIKTSSTGETVGCDNQTISEKALLECVKFAFTSLKSIQGELVKSLSEDIKAVLSKPKSKVDIRALEKKIDTLNAKKMKAIDLQIEGLISKEDLQNRNAEYNEEIGKLQQKIDLAQNADDILKAQVEQIQKCIARVEEICAQTDYTPELYREVVEKMIVSKGGEVAVHFKGIEAPIRVRYTTFGRMENYTVECEVI